MDYSTILTSVKSASTNELKKLVATVDNEQIENIKSMNITKAEESKLISMIKDRAFFEMLLINALK
ncbi:hypothetical protein DW790_06035 [Firmicutes bacterium AM31-12AC]|nr:hypothetical protein DW790_06035 [Firmicutes bacterium AM31-12AC]